MAYQSIWYYSDIPEDVVNILEKDISQTFESQMTNSKLGNNLLNKQKRNSHNAWIPTTHWISGFVWNYVQRANRENFLYDLKNIDGESLQFTRYGPGEFYGWHNDCGLSNHYKPVSIGNRGNDHEIAQDFVNENCELVRKLSFVLQLSDPESYTGGNLQLLDEMGKTYFAPRKKGTMILFDSRTQHRVIKVTSGVRKSIVGWVVGPRWK